MKHCIGLMLVLAPVTVWAAGPFDGTWKGDMSTAVYSGRPDSYTVTKDTFTCSSCNPSLTIPADGKPHAVTGHDYYDVAAATIVSPQIIKLSATLKGKKSRDSTYTVAADGKTVTEEDVDYEGTGSSTTKWTFNRVKDAPPGAHLLSGAWMPDAKSGSGSGTQPVLIYQQSAEGLKFNTPLSSVGYDAKFDGKEYPLTNDDAKSVVVLEKLGPRKIRSTHKIKGKVTGVYTMEVAANGKTMHMVSEDTLAGQTMVFDLKKQ